jgi:hypothetical protein
MALRDSLWYAFIVSIAEIKDIRGSETAFTMDLAPAKSCPNYDKIYVSETSCCSRGKMKKRSGGKRVPSNSWCFKNFLTVDPFHFRSWLTGLRNS